MDPELRQTLLEIKALTKDNHDLLKAMRRDQWLAFAGRIIIWAIVLALPLYLYREYLEPFVTQFQAATTGTTTSGPFGFPSSAELEKLINSLRTGQ